MTNSYKKCGIGATDGKHLYTQQEPKEGMLDTYRSIIGVPVLAHQGDQGLLLLADAIGAWAVERMRGRLFLIPLWPFPTHQHLYQSLWPLMQSMDGLMLPALPQGTDWYAHWQEREPESGPHTWPITWEIALAQLATVLGMPLLAVAEGAEQWNVALGGTLQPPREPSQMDLASPDTWEQAVVRVRAQSKLATCMQHAFATSDHQMEKSPWILPFSPSHQIEKLAPGLRACAQAEEKGIVAFERGDFSFGLGIFPRVDWGLDQEYSTILFEAFLQAALAFALARKKNTICESSRDAICASICERVAQRQPLLPDSFASSERKASRSEHLSRPLASVRSPARPERLRAHTPTREELDRRRRQRLKMLVQ